MGAEWWRSLLWIRGGGRGRVDLSGGPGAGLLRALGMGVGRYARDGFEPGRVYFGARRAWSVYAVGSGSGGFRWGDKLDHG